MPPSDEPRQEDPTVYCVVINHEEQYSIWPLGREIPAGWRDAGTHGTKQECLAHIEQVWTDMRPLSLRTFMQQAADDPSPVGATPAPADDLVERLCAGRHPVEAIQQETQDRPAQRLKEDIDRGYVHLRFTGTRGGTELGLQLDPAQSSYRDADFESGSGTIRLAGTLTLNFVKVRCVADLDLATLSGEGHLERVPGPSA